MSGRIRIAVLLALPLAAAQADAQEPTFEALGQAPIVQGDRVRARERALDEAMRQAVEQAAQTVLEPDQVIARSSDLRLRIYPKARAYVTTYHVLDESEGASGMFQIHVSAQVATGRLARDIFASPTTTSAPAARRRAVVCTIPPASGQLDIGRAAEAAATELLTARGVELAPAPATCSDATCAQAVRAAGAQGGLVATAEVAPTGVIRGSDKLSAHARVKLSLIEADGRPAGDSAADEDAYAASLSQAGERAARRASEAALRTLEPQLVKKWPSQAAGGGGGVHVRVNGLLRFADLVTVERTLAALPGVAGVEPRRFTRGEAELLVRTAQTAQLLANATARAPIPSGVSLQFTDVPPK